MKITTYKFNFDIGMKVEYEGKIGKVEELRIKDDNKYYLLDINDKEIREEELELYEKFNFDMIEKKFNFREYGKEVVREYINKVFSEEEFKTLMEVPKKLNKYCDYDEIVLYISIDPEIPSYQQLIVSPIGIVDWENDENASKKILEIDDKIRNWYLTKPSSNFTLNL